MTKLREYDDLQHCQHCTSTSIAALARPGKVNKLEHFWNYSDGCRLHIINIQYHFMTLLFNIGRLPLTLTLHWIRSRMMSLKEDRSRGQKFPLNIFINLVIFLLWQAINVHLILSILSLVYISAGVDGGGPRSGSRCLCNWLYNRWHWWAGLGWPLGRGVLHCAQSAADM